LSLIVTFTGYAWYQRISGFGNLPTNINIPTTPTTNNSTIFNFGEDDETENEDDNNVPLPRPLPIPTPTPTSQSTAMNDQYKDGIYTGNKEYAYSDYIQVSAVIKGGKLFNITFPAQAIGPQRSQEIYASAMPQLKSEALVAQSAYVNGISGASYTSQAFKLSLHDALIQAKI
jgi:uncharacterized protein with FMN-binding domain